MRLILALLCASSLASGVLCFYGAKGAVHEIAGLILFLISTVCFIAIAILNELHNDRDFLQQNDSVIGRVPVSKKPPPPRTPKR